MGWSVGLAVGVGSRALPVLVLVLVLPLLVLVLLGGPVCPGPGAPPPVVTSQEARTSWV